MCLCQAVWWTHGGHEGQCEVRKEEIPQLPLIAEIVLAYFFRGEGRTEHVAGFRQVVGGSVVEANLNLVIIEAVHVLANFDVGYEIVRIIDGNAVALRQFLKFLLLAFITDGLVADFNFEDVAIDEIVTE